MWIATMGMVSKDVFPSRREDLGAVKTSREVRRKE